jgi:hypothetical protein
VANLEVSETRGFAVTGEATSGLAGCRTVWRDTQDAVTSVTPSHRTQHKPFRPLELPGRWLMAVCFGGCSLWLRNSPSAAKARPGLRPGLQIISKLLRISDVVPTDSAAVTEWPERLSSQTLVATKSQLAYSYGR